jgi:hypothetical protein
MPFVTVGRHVINTDAIAHIEAMLKSSILIYFNGAPSISLDTNDAGVDNLRSAILSASKSPEAPF